MVITSFFPRIFTVADHQHTPPYVQIIPINPTNFVETERGRDGKLYDAGHWHRQTCVIIKATEKAVEFSRCRSAISLNALTDQTEPLERHAGEIDGFS